MFERHIQDQLTAYLDGEMPDNVRSHADAHLTACDHCRAELDRVRSVAELLEKMPLALAPAGLWQTINAAADVPSARITPVWRYATVAAILIIAASAGLWRYVQTPTWEVTTVNGPATSTGNVRTGRWIDTSNGSRARIKIADIGSVDLEPDTRVRLVDTGSAGHRLALESGVLSAKISAPPRLFFVETPAGTAIDLGCEYRLQCDRAGSGILHVTQGWVALEWKGSEVLVPAGASCRTRPAIGPGTPWFDDAAATFITALESFDTSQNQLNTILEAARPRDTLTLWHLLSRVSAAERARVYDRMAALAPPPAGVTREQILSLQAEPLTRWKNELAWIW